jgi:hypothetical protein
MPYLAGIVLALTVSGLATLVGLDRDRAFYPTVLVVIASYYVLFAVIGGSGHALVVETLVMTGFLLVALIGFKKNLWLVVAALAAMESLMSSTAALWPIWAFRHGGRRSA